MADRDFDGVLHSFQRNQIDGLWKQLGIDPLDDRAHFIESTLILAVFKHIFETKDSMKREWDAEQERNKHR